MGRALSDTSDSGDFEKMQRSEIKKGLIVYKHHKLGPTQYHTFKN